MVKLILMFAVATLFLLPQVKPQAQKTPDLVVLKFSCGISKPRNSMIRSVQDPDPPRNEPIRIDQTARNEPQEVINRRDMQERRAELKTAETNAVLSNQRESSLYFYNLEIRNVSAKALKNFSWAYQPGESLDTSDRQFFCVVKAKPNERKQFQLLSPLAPSRVVDASRAGESEENMQDRVIVNRIEYMDGSVWQRPGWDPATFSAAAKERVANGKCIGL
jgi:hypothetical protein